ncbi:MAG TPA: hypothetical protein VGH49_13575, partial [Xanthobacteraceae bacterium]
MAPAIDNDALARIKATVKTAVKTGVPPTFSAADLVAVSTLPSLPVVPSVIEFDATDDPLADVEAGLYALAALFPSLPLAQWIPRDGLLGPLTAGGANKIVAVDQIGFTVQKGPDPLAGISVGVALGQNRAGFTVTPLSDLNISATLSHLAIQVTAPFRSPTVVVTLAGDLRLGDLDLDVTLECPSFDFTATEKPLTSPSFASLLAAFALPAPSCFSTLLLTGVQLTVTSRAAAVNFRATITASQDVLPVLGDILGLDSLMLSLDYANKKTAAIITARLTVHKTIVLGTVLSNGDAGWTATASLDLPATLANLNQPTATALKFGDLLTALGLDMPAVLASSLDTVAIVAFGGGVTIPPGDGKRTYTLNVEFTTDWSLGGITLATDTVVTLGSDLNTIVGTVLIDNFELVLEYDFANQKNANSDTILKASTPHLGNLTGTYDVTTKVATLSLADSGTTLGQLLADFIAIFTGDSFTTLPEPWDLLNDVGLDALSLTVDCSTPGTKVIEIDYNGLQGATFLGFGVTGFGLTYDTAKAKAKAGGSSGFAFKVKGNFPMLSFGPVTIGPTTGTDPAWDPKKPATAPTAPGLGAAYLDVLLAAVGQHVTVADSQGNAPTTVEGALDDIKGIVKQIDDGGPLPVGLFNKDAGWLIGARMILLGQIDARLIFADPQIYGVQILVRDDLNIKGAPKSDYLTDLVGLSAEILYRKVSSTIGVYEGFLTLPDKIRKIDMDAFSVQLPSLAVKVFTNGDFEIDIGYPHNGDFSHSCIITAAEYYGAGGLLFGKLSGATDDQLPTIALDRSGHPVGAFGNVIEIGLGFQVGISRSFSEGPMSASMSVLLQGIFQGTFSKFTTNPNPVDHSQSSEDYYSVYASITIIGKLEGELDFVIVTASLLVEIVLSAAINAITRQQVTVPMSASVDVELTVSMNCGLFTIHIHVGFSTTVHYTATFGNDDWA